MSEGALVALITTLGTSLVAGLTAWAAVHKTRVEAEAQMTLIKHRLDKMEEKFNYFGSIFDRLARLETWRDGLEAKR